MRRREIIDYSDRRWGSWDENKAKALNRSKRAMDFIFTNVCVVSLCLTSGHDNK